MAFRIRPAVKETLRLTDEQCRFLAARGVTSLILHVYGNVPKETAIAMGFPPKHRDAIGLARLLDPAGRYRAGFYDHKDRNQLNYSPGNTWCVTATENARNKNRSDDFLVFA